MLATIALVVVVLIAAVLAIAATRPATFRVERETSINAPPEKVFALLDDFRNFGKDFEAGLANLKAAAEK